MLKLTANSKLAKSSLRTVGFGTTPVKTCPGAGVCATYCYGCKGLFRTFAKTVQAAWAHNEQELASDDASDNVSSQLRRRRKLEALRCFTTGDVTSQFVLNRLTEIARRNPELKVYLYTKSLHLDWASFQALPNTRMIQSFGGRWDDRIDVTRPHARIFDNRDELIKAGYTDCSSDDSLALTCVKVGLIAH